ncbi:phosphomevalonate kinase [Acholeplasma equirhinis]|uniref:phosphomevalonate kinase n=1 Tax=Acholeplasma equirhinis TaxID=555393 RepID=UPI00197A99B0|nr:phosphomevalonate kinase [Acholeplasma equirhinis]MBN3490463.1 phosphomevalonate kinase [Acholeplasma equirhinis]
MISLKVPGKLYIIGEYSVLKPGNEAVLVAVDKFINVTVDASKTYEFSSELGHFKWMLSDKLPVFVYDTLTHAKAAVYVAHLYLNYKQVEPKVYSINLSSELTTEENQKYGLGSSGAVVVSVIKGILDYHNVKIKKLDLFKLAVLAQIEINDISSGGELAASIFGGWVHYTRYDLIWVMNHKGKLDEVMTLTWPFLKITRLPKPPFELAICYSGISQSTSQMVGKMQTINQSPWYATFLNKTKLIVTQFKEALVRNDYFTTKYMLEMYRDQLLDLQSKSGIIIESSPFKKMMQIASDYGLPAKTSGAGFGDCGFAIAQNKNQRILVQDAWFKAGLTPLELNVWEYNEQK